MILLNAISLSLTQIIVHTQDHIPCGFAYKVVCVNNKFSKKVVLYSEKNAVCNFISSILNEYNYWWGVVGDKETFR